MKFSCLRVSQWWRKQVGASPGRGVSESFRGLSPTEEVDLRAFSRREGWLHRSRGMALRGKKDKGGNVQIS